MHEWATKISEQLQQQHWRPRRLLVLLNPYGGARLARHIWATMVQPMFDKCGRSERCVLLFESEVHYRKVSVCVCARARVCACVRACV